LALISSNSTLSNPVPLMPASLGSPSSTTAGPIIAASSVQGAAPPIPVPSKKIESNRIEFSGTGGEYFRIWIVNLLLILVTLGVYYPWAKVRKIKYFYNNTQIDGHALDFHGEPKKMLRGSAIVGVFFILYSMAVELSPLAGAIAIIAFLVLAPVLFRASMRFRLANTSWRGMRFRFVAKDLKEAYWCIVPPLALLLLPGLILAFLDDPDDRKKGAVMPMEGSAVSLYALLAAVLIPYFFWRLKRYQHNHYAWGPLKSEYRSEVGATYKVFGMTFLLSVLIGAVFVALIYVLIFSNTGGGARSWGAMFAFALTLVPLLFAFVVAINVAPRAYFTASMQNLLWSRTGNQYFRFKSELPIGRFIGLQFKNWLLIMITLGLYWPFAAVATARMQLEAVSLKSRVSLDQLSDAARARENDAAGDMAADIFGFDVGM
jgi:uncharacterized membrane protein YjgN (DUF898 family)